MYSRMSTIMFHVFCGIEDGGGRESLTHHFVSHSSVPLSSQ